ncbi:MAG: tetratricopeptide repeat protein [Coriobacteriia bacterium]|nr:tetratricopeptide repeat protein [Coriobacteriia bacterium]
MEPAAWLWIAIAVAGVSLLTLAGYAVWAGLFDPQPPRTSQERQLSVLSALITTKPTDQYVWADYIQALVDTHQYGRALTVIAQARTAIGDAPQVDVQEARYHYLRDDRQRALSLLEGTVARIEARRAEKREANMRKGTSGEIVKLDTEAMVKALLLTARIHADLGRLDEAIVALTRALKDDPSMADVLIARGDLYARKNAVDLAAEDYRAALRFMPDNAAARAGLARIGKGQAGD